MNRLENKIPPPLVMLLSALLIKAISLAGFILNIPTQLRISAALAFIVTGLMIDLSAILGFRKAKTTINPLKPNSASSLVIVGIYQYSRNPMYLGLVLILLGVTVYFASPVSLLAVVIFIAYISRFQISPEERAMHEMFGEEFSRYCQQVRRWI